MKKIFIAFTLIFLTASFSSQLLAQTKTCTPQQTAACKKICGTATVANCTTAQKAACEKVCSKSGEAKVASYDGFKIPAFNVAKTGTASCQKKMASCSPASSVKMAKNEKASCMKSNTKIVKNEEESVKPFAQKVVLGASASNN
ncbi:MAG: hypothetical protein AB8F94_14585 [Saprospiraceae bacterium]